MSRDLPRPVVRRRPIIGVMGSHADRHSDRARQVGTWVAHAGLHLLTGGGDGVMAAVTEAFTMVTDRVGLAVAIVPADPSDPDCRPLAGYPNPWVELPIYTHLDRGPVLGDEPSSRNHLNVLTSTVVVILPGGTGTASEARLAVRYQRPCVAYLDRAEEVPGLPDGIPVESSFARVEAFIRRHL